MRNVLIVSLDTLRADRLGVYGYPRGTSPNIDAIASRSVVFQMARAQAPQTAPSHASLFTSEYPGVHRIINVHGPDPQLFTLPEGLRTLAEVLDEAGYDTGAFVSGGNLTGRMGMDRGFDVWDERYADVSDRFNRAIEWIFAKDRGPFFAFVHTYQVHAPYLPPRELVGEFTEDSYQGPLRARTEHFLDMPQQEAWAKATGPEYWEGMLDYTADDVRFLSDLYDAEVRYLDGEVRRLFEYLAQSGLLKDTLVILLSDHGEEFKDHGKYQHDQVFEELLHVPLILRLPPVLEEQGFRGSIETPVELIDVGPTVLELVGLDPASLGAVQGTSLVPLMREPTRVASRFEQPVLSELVVDPGPKYHWAVTHQGWKYVLIWQANIDHTWEQLFHLERDPGERNNLIASDDPAAVRALAALKELLRQHRARSLQRADRVGPGGSAEIDDEMRRQMEALGYVGLSDGALPGDGSPGGAATEAEDDPPRKPEGTGDDPAREAGGEGR